jgi:hypothetical protein
MVASFVFLSAVHAGPRVLSNQTLGRGLKYELEHASLSSCLCVIDPIIFLLRRKLVRVGKVMDAIGVCIFNLHRWKS